MGVRRMALVVLVSLCLAPMAHAQDATDFASKISATYSVVGYDLKFGPSTSKDGTITYDGLSVTLGGAAAPGFSYKFDTKLTFTGVKSLPDGSYRADALTLPDMTFKADDAEVSIKQISLNHIYAPGSKTPSLLDLTQLVGDASAGPITVEVKGAKAVTIDEVTFKNSFTPAQGDKALSAINSTSAANGIVIDLGTATDPDAVAQAKALGLTTVTGKAIENLAWSFGDGHMNASELSLGFDNVGKIKLAFDLTGYTPELLQHLMEAEKSLANSGTSGQASSEDTGKQTAALLAALQTVFLNSASIRYDDASITTRLLDYNAKQQNITKDALINQIVVGAPMAMSEGQTSTPDQMTLLSQAALRAFLTDPHSIEVRVAPKTPLGVMGLVGAAMAPDSLADQIGLQVLVNDKEITAADAAAEAKLDAATAAGAPATPADTTTSTDAAPADDTTTPSDSTSATPDAGPDNSGDAATTASDGGTDKLSVTHLHSN